MPSHITRPRGKIKQCTHCERVFTKEEHLKRHERAPQRSDVLFRHSQTHTSTSDEKQDEYRARRLSSDVVVVNTSGDKQSPSVPFSMRQSPTSFESPIPGALDYISQALPQHVSSDPSSIISALSTEYQIEGTPHVDLGDFREDSVMKDLVDFVLQNHRQDDDKLSDHIQQEKIYETGSPRPRKARKLSPQSRCRNDASQGSTMGHPSFAISLALKSQLDFDLPPTFTREETHQQNPFDMFSFDVGQTPILDDTQFNPDVMDLLNFDTSDPRFSMPTVDTVSCNSIPRRGGLMTISTGQMQKVQQIWSRQRPKVPLRITNRLWSGVIKHNADNIFTTPQDSPNIESCPSLGCNVDHECRTRLIRYCNYLDISLASSSTATLDISMPSVDILDSSLDFYFQFFHPILPVIHKSTFDARNTPSPLLLAMCLVGLSYLDRTQTKAFLIRYLRLLPACHSDLMSRIPSQCAPGDFLTTLATVLIVAYLALGFRDQVDAYQAYMLCTQTLRVADEQGLFAAEDRHDSIVKLGEGASDSDSLWKAWGRVESIKRLICCLIYLDMAYARLMNTSGVIEVDKVEIHLPCDDSLFDDATTAAAFLRFTQMGAQMTMPRMNIRNIHTVSASKLNQNSTQILLRSLYLRVIAANARLSNKSGERPGFRPTNPVETLAEDKGSKDIISDVVLLAKMHGNFLSGQNQNNTLGWHYLCILLTADIDLLETACGRDGLEAAEASLVQVIKWSRSSSARRALLHAAQVFKMLDSCRVRESYLTRPDLVLFVSALVISQYFLFTSHIDNGFDVPTFELVQDIDWATLGDDGFGNATGRGSSSMTRVVEWGVTSKSVRGFLRNGGPVSFAGEAQGLGGVTAKKIARKFAHLMEGFGKWDGCSYSQLLRAMCGFTQDSE
ncbi:hypothetical protein FSARC_9099 [Fusarium sarcochroum]|uniref:C2H2-type domain-containing protein n=1 Tax=Fusarium sarcochroum TaxID=1208366 RepID=A0A8H4TRL8_9HYPO|nr:hypothetical protein FSARC_9099 [Fusarium sarcochroum]